MTTDRPPTVRGAPPAGVMAYLHRLGVEDRPAPTLDTLVRIHRRHLATVPYENLAIMLGRPPSTDAGACLARVVEVGRAGYCFHQNGALETVLRALGYAVERRHGHVYTDEERRFEGSLNHLVLVVSGLPTDANPEGRWWVDVGLGDGFVDPLPIVVGEHVQGGFRYVIDEVRPNGWHFRHDPTGTFAGVEVSGAATDPATVVAAHTELSTPPDGVFARTLVVQRRDDAGVDVVRGCVRSRVEQAGTTSTDLETYAAWLAALAGDLGLTLHDVPDRELHDLWERSQSAHRAWVAEGRP